MLPAYGLDLAEQELRAVSAHELSRSAYKTEKHMQIIGLTP